MASYLRNLKGLNHDIFVNFVDKTVTDEIVARVKAEFPAATVVVSPNIGRDAGGILRLCEQAEINEYGSVLVIHGKRSVAIKAAYGDLWRRTLIDPLVGTPTIARLNLALMAADQSVGLIGSAACASTFVGENAQNIAALADRIGIAPEDRHAPFVAGSMFLIRAGHMARMRTALQGLDFLHSDNPVSANSVDGHLEHAVERVYGSLVKAARQRIVWRDTRVTNVNLVGPGEVEP